MLLTKLVIAKQVCELSDYLLICKLYLCDFRWNTVLAIQEKVGYILKLKANMLDSSGIQ